MAVGREVHAMVRTIVKGAAAAAVLVVIGASAGCYSHVVGARGVGADTVQIEEPYQQDTKLDEMVYGPRPSKGRSLITERSR